MYGDPSSNGECSLVRGIAYMRERKIVWDRMRRIWRAEWPDCAIFLKFLDDKLTHKISQNEWRQFGLIWKVSLPSLNSFASFGHFLEKFGVLFISTSGHTDEENELRRVFSG